MTLNELLEHEIFSFPKRLNGDSIHDFLKKNFEIYLLLLNQISDVDLIEQIKHRSPIIESFCDSLIEASIHIKKGHHHRAFNEFSNAMQLLDSVTFSKWNGGRIVHGGIQEPFYRARVSETPITLRGEMFHLPFTIRNHANSQRFSVPGLPCLYLSNSIYVCWEELNRPSANCFFVSRFQKENHQLNVIDLSLTANNLKVSRKLNPNPYIDNFGYDVVALDFFTLWPSTMACSLSISDDRAPFKPEYVFPQFLLEWVSTQINIDGIKYFSIKSNPYNSEDYSTLINYVFPPKNFNSGNYCEFLRSSFKLTKPVLFDTLRFSEPTNVPLDRDWLQNTKYKVMIENILVELIPGRRIPYVHSEFGRLEILMQNAPIDFLSEEEMKN